MEQLEYLESERQKLWERIAKLEFQLEQLRPETEQEASNASRKASEFRNRARATADEVAKLHTVTVSSATELTHLHQRASDETVRLQQLAQSLSEEHSRLLALNKDAKAARDEINVALEAARETHESLEEKNGEIEETGSAITKAQELQQKGELLFKNTSEVAQKIQQVHTEIFGYEETKDGKSTKVYGLKDKLEKSYDDLTSKAAGFNDKIDHAISDMDGRLLALHAEWSNKHGALKAEIERLLPKALTAGLSFAYSDKKVDELAEGTRLAKVFYAAIGGLILVSLIPFGVAFDAIQHGTPLQDAITRMPRLVLAILPLYVPVAWVAYSANRRANLSKRLVEEYSHKEVLAKTYEGLSKQVAELPGDLSTELRTKLLYNILEISAENPGKLISDYNKADHPLMDALEKSVQLTNAVERLSRIPGFSKVAVHLKEKADRVLDEENAKAEAGLRSVGSNSGP